MEYVTRSFIYLFLGATLFACGGGGGSSRQAATVPPPSPSPPPATISTYTFDLATEQVVSAAEPTTTGTASVTVRHNETDSEWEIEVVVTNLTPTVIEVVRGWAGEVGEVMATLTEDSATGSWQLDVTGLTADEENALLSGQLAIRAKADVSGTDAPILRGQVLTDGVALAKFHATAKLVGEDLNTAASAYGWITTYEDAEKLAANLTVFDATDIDSAILGRGIAGERGATLAALAQNPDDASHWSVVELDNSGDVGDAFASGSLYVLMSSPAHPNGVLRGQSVPSGTELVTTELRSGGLVATGYSTITGADIKSRVRTPSSATATTLSVELKRAPAGINGPTIATLQQDSQDPLLWSTDLVLDGAQQAALENQGLYLAATTDAVPDIVRAQIVTDASMAPPNTSTFAVVDTDPDAGAALGSWPDALTVTFNRNVLAATVGDQTVLVWQSGGDASFDEGNETRISPNGISVSGASVEVDLAGLAPGDDTYLIEVVGDGANPVSDVNGVVLDGDGDGAAGGNFEAAFSVSTPTNSVTLTQLQDTIFTPSCATSGCHAGSNPPDGLDLSEGASFANIVNVASVQMPTLMLIAPNNPDDSYLVRKVEGSGIVANRMPLGQPPLDQSLIDDLRAWVEAGALDN